ncbi:uncharacterized protein SAPINGB_P001427 [Magnusiomyces paraingens]|uniref:Protoheme IX farnesyltransferase, mitochondrial n=1 Tax=Magnusiomyces paraingens TaxID=2606893 RepID=A0A5E8BBT7_9ASCO|nr:uncharacterized protein SAPINGB_P001427 [Saprochaete ingens]VVT46867.1 unnamed protein product [Saprochaete ingens]
MLLKSRATGFANQQLLSFSVGYSAVVFADIEPLARTRRFFVSQNRSPVRRRTFSSSGILASVVSSGLASSHSSSSSKPFDFLSNSFLQIALSSTSSTPNNSESSQKPIPQTATSTEDAATKYATSAEDAALNPFPTPIRVSLSPDSKPVVDFATKAFSCVDKDESITKPTDTVSQAATASANTPFVVTPVDTTTKKSVSKAKTQSPFAPYIALTKPRLSALVVLSAMSAYALTPNHATLAQLLFLTIGTTLSSGSANAINMGREYQYDALMTRTRTRPVVRGLITPNQAFSFAAISGIVGVSSLYWGVNPTVAYLGASNIILYGIIYTTLKRKSISNTWVGAVVGAIPPLMGWAASSSLADPGAWCLAALLYTWQFPHFNALSHSIRDEYKNAGYVMAAWTNPALNARVALRYSLLMFPICIGMSYFNITDWVFAFDSSLVNGWLTLWAYKFWLEQRSVKPIANRNGVLYQTGLPFNMNTNGSGQGSYSSSAKCNGFARKLFWGSVIHLPAILLLAMIHKKGQWDWLFGSGEEEEEDDGTVRLNESGQSVLQSS